ncbi:MAG: hypothetical protein U1F53_07205 [Burkholderiaceae bacterium]
MTTLTPPDDPLLRLDDDALGARLHRAAALPDAPAAWQQRALAAWRAPVPVPSLAGQIAAGLADGLQRLVASLRFDSWATAPLAAGLRSAGPSPTRQLVFSVEGRDVDLRIAPAGATFQVSGQILGPDESGTAVLVAPGGDASASLQATVDPLGEFRLAAVPAGHYELRLILGRDELVMPGIEVGATPAA